MYDLEVGVTARSAHTFTVTVLEEVTVAEIDVPSATIFVPSLGVAIAGIPTVAPVTVAVPLAQAPASSAEPPMEPVVPLKIAPLDMKLSPVGEA